jgi:hypothetical protein
MSAIRTFDLESEGGEGRGAREVELPSSSMLAWFDYIDQALRDVEGRSVRAVPGLVFPLRRLAHCSPLLCPAAFSTSII